MCDFYMHWNVCSVHKRYKLNHLNSNCYALRKNWYWFSIKKKKYREKKWENRYIVCCFLFYLFKFTVILTKFYARLFVCWHFIIPTVPVVEQANRNSFPLWRQPDQRQIVIFPTIWFFFFSIFLFHFKSCLTIFNLYCLCLYLWKIAGK